MVNKKKGCESATSKPFKQSDAKRLGADAKIIIALLNHQPQKRLELCKNASIDKSSFSRHKRLLTNERILKVSKNGFSLCNYKETPSLWDSLVDEMKEAGGHLIKLQIEKLHLGDYDPITGIPEILYNETISAEGIFILRGATNLENALKLRIPQNYVAFIATSSLIEQGDRFKWKNLTYYVNEAQSFFDGETLSYSLGKLRYCL